MGTKTRPRAEHGGQEIDVDQEFGMRKKAAKSGIIRKTLRWNREVEGNPSLKDREEFKSYIKDKSAETCLAKARPFRLYVN